MLGFKMNRKSETRGAGVESKQHRQPSWVSVRGRLGVNKAILVSRYATADSEKGRFILDFWRNSSFQDIIISSIFTSVKLKSDGFKQQNVDNLQFSRNR